MTYRVKNITIAVALALVAALLTSFYVTNYQRNVRKDETNVAIWVAKRDIPAGTTGADIERKGMLGKSEIVRRSVVPGAISNPDQVAELVTSQPIYAGEQVSTRRFSTPSQRGIKAQLTGVQRAIEIPGDQHQLLAGTLKAGDKVDLVATFGAGGSNGPNVTRIVLRDIEVLRAPSGGGTEAKITSASDKDGGVRRDAEGHGHAGAEARTGSSRPPSTGTSSSARASTPRTAPRTSSPGTRCCAKASARSSSTTRAWNGSRPSVEVTPMNNESIRIYVTGSCEGLDNLRDQLANHPDLDFVGWSENVAEATTALAGGHLRVVVHATRSTSFPAGEVAAIREHTRSPIVIIASGESSALLEEALDAEGVADVLLLPQLTENVVFALRKAAHAGRRLVAEGATHGRHGRIVTVFSPKGGTGKTVTATNLAASFAKYEQKRTLLLDLDLQFGDAAIMLGLEPEKTIYDLVVAPGELDSEKLAGYTTKHTCGLDILPAPLRPEDAELVTESKLARLLEVARESYDIIVVDTSPFFHGPMLATLDRTDELLMLCGLDVPTLKNVRLSMQTLELLSFPASRIRFVLNRANSKVGMKKSEVEGALDVKIGFEVPSDRAVPLGVNRGAPPAIADTGSDFAKAIRVVAKSLLANEQPKKKRKFAALAKA